jgi:predicted GIY-YIG superfamily endonuclease
MEYLYRLYGEGEALLYAGITDDWTRRLREHSRIKPWLTDVLSVKLERYPDRAAVVAAERRAIRSEKPRYNIHHNIGFWGDSEPASTWTAEEVLTLALLALIVGYALYKLTELAAAKYREWKGDRQEYLRWKRDRQQSDAAGPQRPSDAHPARLEAAANNPVTSPRVWAVPDLTSQRAHNPVIVPPSPNATEASPASLGVVAMVVIAASVLSPGTLRFSADITASPPHPNTTLQAPDE